MIKKDSGGGLSTPESLCISIGYLLIACSLRKKDAHTVVHDRVIEEFSKTQSKDAER